MRSACALAVLLWCVAAVADEPIDLNRATQGELEKLPGIGPSKARAIIEDRETNGPFDGVDELDRVKGFGKATIERLRPFLTISGRNAAPPKPVIAPVRPPPVAPPPPDAPLPIEKPLPVDPATLDALERENPEGKVNVNLATIEELQALNGVAAINAKIIVVFREKKGPFRRLAEVARVPGLPSKVFQTIAYFITLRADATRVTEDQLSTLGLSGVAAASFVSSRKQQGAKFKAAALATIPALDDEDRALLRDLLYFPVK